MPKPLRIVLPTGLLALTLMACAMPPPQTPAGRHAVLVEAADVAAGQVVDHLAGRERQEVEQAASLRFATGTMPRALPAPATPAVGQVLDPGMELVLLQAQRLAALADGQGPAEPPAGPAILARVQGGLAALRATPGRWPSEAVRRRGLEGFRVLSEPAPAGVDAASLARDRQRALTDAVALMRAVVGEDARSGLRGVLAQRHGAWRQAQTTMLNAARNDRNLSPAERMEVWQATQARLAGDDPDVAAVELLRLLAALPVAHAAAGAGDAAGVEAFAAEVARIEALVAQAR